MRKIWIGTGWKMNHLLAQAEVYCRTLREFVESKSPNSQVFIIPPFTVLRRVCELLEGSAVKIGAQNMHWEDRGAYTGEVSPLMIKDCGAHMVELGHSERRARFGETDFTVNKKVLAALKRGLTPLICVGETATEKGFGVAKEFLLREVKIALNGVPGEKIGNVVFAYEPVWAIGESGTPAEPEYANAVHGLIRKTISELYGERITRQIPVLYGGSVNDQNARSFMRQPEIDGLFVGRAAWAVEGLIQIVEMIEEGGRR
jgi:triosephosphate isomerase